MKPIPRRLLHMRSQWRYTGAERPSFALEPGPGQESVWDYPRPPRLAPDARRVVVRIGGSVVADTKSAIRVLETAGAPTFYLPPADTSRGLLQPGTGSSLCEWKGRATYVSVRADEGWAENAGWMYPDPYDGFENIAGFLSFYPARLECYVDGERVRPQPGGFYGGWVTDEIVGPIKGEPGTEGW